MIICKIFFFQATGSRIGSLLQAFATIAFGTAIAFFYTWKLTLVALVELPIVLASVFFESR